MLLHVRIFTFDTLIAKSAFPSTDIYLSKAPSVLPGDFII